MILSYKNLSCETEKLWANNSGKKENPRGFNEAYKITREEKALQLERFFE